MSNNIVCDVCGNANPEIYEDGSNVMICIICGNAIIKGSDKE